MRIAKIEYETPLATPEVDINVDSTLELYGGSEEDKVRVITGLEPDYPAYQTDATTFFSEYPSVETEFSGEVSDRPFGKYVGHEHVNDSDIELTVFPGSNEEKKYSFSDWYQLRRESQDDLFNEIANSVLNNDRRLFWEPLHQEAEFAINEEIPKSSFRNWLSDIERPQYEYLVRESREEDIIPFKEGGVYSEDLEKIVQSHIHGGRVMRGDKQIGRIKTEPDFETSRNVEPTGLENIEGIFVPQNHESSLIEYLQRFS